MVTLHLYCAFCHEKTEIEVATEWGTRYGVAEDEGAMCPKHKNVEAFFAAQCPGCVAGWPDCGFGRSLERETITDNEIHTVSSAHCPWRVNGTMTTVRTGDHVEVGSLDISDPASEETAQATVQAIKDLFTANAQWRAEHPDRR